VQRGTLDGEVPKQTKKKAGWWDCAIESWAEENGAGARSRKKKKKSLRGTAKTPPDRTQNTSGEGRTIELRGKKLNDHLNPDPRHRFIQKAQPKGDGLGDSTEATGRKKGNSLNLPTKKKCSEKRTKQKRSHARGNFLSAQGTTVAKGGHMEKYKEKTKRNQGGGGRLQASRVETPSKIDTDSGERVPQRDD